MTISENSSIPSVDVAIIDNSDSGSINTSDYFSSGNFVLVGVPGAFTPTCHLQHFPGYVCLLYTSPSPRDKRQSRMPSSA